MTTKPLRLVLLGAPGSGKGSFASVIAPHFNIPTISTGQLIRDELKQGTELGKSLAAITASGSFVSDDIVLGLLKQRLAQDDCQNGFILDGFPRTLEQATALAQFVDITFALQFILPYSVITQATAGRRSCAQCAHGYNIADIDCDGIKMPPLLPKVANTCDKCGANPIVLEQRADDKEDIVKHRLEVYDKLTVPILDLYRSQNKLVSHNVKNGKRDWQNTNLKEILENEVKSRQ